MYDFEGVNNASQIVKTQGESFLPHDFYSFFSPAVLQGTLGREEDNIHLLFTVLTPITPALGKHLSLWAYVKHM